MKKKIIIIISLLLAVTAVISTVYLCNREKVASGSILIKTTSGDTTVNLSDLTLSAVEGETINKKGETKKISGEGYPVSDIPALAGITDYSTVSVFSDDEYNAQLSVDELSEKDKAWIIIDEGSPRLIVFGDKNSKRNVKNVVRIEIR